MNKLQFFEVAELLGEVRSFYQQEAQLSFYDKSNGTLYGVYQALYNQGAKVADEFLNRIPVGNRRSDHDLTRTDILLFVEEEWIDHMVARLDELKADYKNHYGKAEPV